MSIIQEKFLAYIVEELQEQYSLSEQEAKEILDNSFVPRLMKSDPEYVMHYNVEDLAEEIMRSNTVSCN